MRIFLLIFITGSVLAGLPNQPAQTVQKRDHSGGFQPIFTPSNAVRTLRQQPQGYQYNQPSPAFFLPQQQVKPQPIQQVVLTTPRPSFVPIPAPAPLPAPVAIPLPAPAPAPSRPVLIQQPVIAPLPPTTPSPAYIPPAPVPTTARPVPLPPPPPPVIVEPIRPNPIPVIPIIPSTPPPPVIIPTQPQRPIIIPPAPPVQPVIVDQTNMALMPQLPTQQMPQIISLDVSCSKESMVVRIRFDQIFNGLIYSKGFHSNQACNYVAFNSGRDSYEFTIRLDSCGSQWVDELSSGGQAYLENVIIIQNEPGIQEIWDTSRRIRCLWEGSLQKVVTYAFSVDMLDSQIVSFSGDTATAIMDIQIGKGPFAPSVNGLVKIGETLTMVISIEGDPGFDVQVKDCVAHDGNRNNPIILTDNRGCVLKKKLMGPWQKTRQVAGARAGVSLIAYSFFQAFKFPDQMEVFLECNVELCKNQCDVCPEDAALFDIRSRNRRAINNSTSAVSDVRLVRRLRVVTNDDIALNSDRRSTITLTTGE